MESFYQLNNKLLFTTVSGTLLLFLMHLTGKDQIVSGKLSGFFNLDINISYWLLYLTGALFFLLINLILTYVQFKNHTLKSRDWDIIKKDLFKKRAIYNFSSKQTELMPIPKYMYFIFVFLVLFGFISAVNELVFLPVDALLSSTNHENIFSFQKNDHPTLFLFILIPPYIFLWLVFFLGKLLKR